MYKYRQISLTRPGWHQLQGDRDGDHGGPGVPHGQQDLRGARGHHEGYVSQNCDIIVIIL